MHALREQVLNARLFALHKLQSLPRDNPLAINVGEKTCSVELVREVDLTLADLRAFVDVERVRHQLRVRQHKVKRMREEPIRTTISCMLS